jgi:hypothetical protein
MISVIELRGMVIQSEEFSVSDRSSLFVESIRVNEVEVLTWFCYMMRSRFLKNKWRKGRIDIL